MGQTPKKLPKIRHVKTSKGNQKLDFDHAHDQESFIDVVGAECCETVGTECPCTSQGSSNTSKQVNVLSTHEVFDSVFLNSEYEAETCQSHVWNKQRTS